MSVYIHVFILSPLGNILTVYALVLESLRRATRSEHPTHPIPRREYPRTLKIPRFSKNDASYFVYGSFYVVLCLRALTKSRNADAEGN